VARAVEPTKLEEPVVDPGFGVFDGVGGVHDDEDDGTAVFLAADHAPEPLHHLAAAAAGGQDDPQVDGGDVDAFVVQLRRSERS